jgi:hypothetical protein
MLVRYKCNLCNNQIKKIVDSDKTTGYLNCFCGGVLEKQLPEISTSSLEIVDNGNMARQVELRQDIKSKLKERGDKLTETLEQRDKPTDKK